MKTYTKTIPATLAEKLKEKGMPITYSKHLHQIAPDVRGIVVGNFEEIDCPNYAEVFDWLMEKGQCINITPDGLRFNFAERWRYTCYGKRNYVSAFASDWCHTADNAIRTALSEIEKEG